MIQLSDSKEVVLSRLSDCIRKFSRENGTPASMGVYCCPGSGWISFCFNQTKSISEASANCPDFEFVEYELLEMPEWAEEYNSERVQVRVGPHSIRSIDPEADGDDSYNEVFFAYLLEILPGVIPKELKGKMLLQMLDSQYSAVL